VGTHLVVVSPSLRIVRHHICFDLDIDTLLGVASAHPTDPTRLGVRNLSDSSWRVTTKGGLIGELAPGRSIELQSDVRQSSGDHVVRLEPTNAVCVRRAW
jgi:hypothetical protein